MCKGMVRVCSSLPNRLEVAVCMKRLFGVKPAHSETTCSSGMYSYYSQPAAYAM